MRVPLSWLQEYIPLPESPAELVEKFTRAGLEATSFELYGWPTPEGLAVKQDAESLVWERDKVVVARVTKIEKHPDADKLKLVTVDLGTPTPITVVTGAPNIAPGQSGMKVVLGLRGTRYFAADKSGNKTVLTLEPKELRGIMNEAMCMSNYELGISDEHEGIIILDDNDPSPGTALQDVLGELVVDLDVLPNMARCLSMLGIAREVSALTDAHVTEPNLDVVTSDDAIDGLVKIAIENPKLCPRYSATIIRNIKVGPSPRWMQSRLTYAGMRPINNVVDITNFAMLEWGQPLHAFDYDVLLKRAGELSPTITIRLAKDGETLTTLDGQNRKLSADDLVIADEAGPIALAGVMGGAETEVTATTKTILLESASFDFVSVRKTARRYTLFSEASTRFSKGVSPELVKPTALRAAQLFQKHAEGHVLAGMIDNYPAPMLPEVVTLQRTEISRLLGMSIPDVEVERVLRALQFELEPTADGWSVTVPTTRLDIQAGAADLIEDLARIVGYDRLPETRLSQELPEQLGNPSLEAEERFRDSLANLGLQEAICYSLSNPEVETLFDNQVGFVTIVNPVSPERSVMRRSLLPGLIAVGTRNLRHRDSVRMFEIGPVFLPNTISPLSPGGEGPGVRGLLSPSPLGERVGVRGILTPSPLGERVGVRGKATSANHEHSESASSLPPHPQPLSPRGEGGNNQLPSEPRRLALVLAGSRDASAWDDPLGQMPKACDFFDIKGIIESLTTECHWPNVTYELASDVPWLHPAESAKLLVNGNVMGSFGRLHPKVAKQLGVGSRTMFVGEFDLDAMIAAIPNRVAYTPVSIYEAVLRDVAVVVPEATPASQIIAEIQAGGGDTLEDVKLFDLYRGESIPEGTKSLAFTLSYRLADRPLTDKEVDKLHNKIEGRLKHVLNARIRGKS